MSGKRDLTIRNIEIRFDSTECDITNEEVSCYVRAPDSFDISLSGFKVLKEVFKNINGGEKIKKGDVYMRILSKPRCSLCNCGEKCLYLDSPTNRELLICEDCVLLSEDMCRVQRDNLIRYNEIFKVLHFSEGQVFHDMIDDKTFDMKSVMVINHSILSLELSKVEKLINSLQKPLEYEFTSKTESASKTFDKDFCTACEKESKNFVCYHSKYYICEDCQEKISSSLTNYLEEHKNEIISLRI